MKAFSDMAKYLIEDDVPLPEIRGKPKSELHATVEKLKVGQSFQCPYSEAKSVRNILARQHKDKTFTTKKRGDFLRIWRVT